MLICQYCEKECKNKNSHTNHERLCPKNLDRIYVNGMTGKTAWNKGLTINDPRVQKNADGINLAYAEGRVDKTYLDNPKYLQRLHDNAIKQGFGGYRAGAGRSKKFFVNDSFGKQVCLQSTFELKCAEILNELNIQWIRPSYIKYDTKKYFPDFYLVDHDIYLDPKNNFLAIKDKDKIDRVCDQNDVTVIILTEEKLTTEYICALVSPNGEGLS